MSNLSGLPGSNGVLAGFFRPAPLDTGVLGGFFRPAPFDNDVSFSVVGYEELSDKYFGNDVSFSVAG